MRTLSEIARKRNSAHRKLKAYGSRVYDAFLRMESAAYEDGALPKLTKELIAVGISVYADCESCMQWHIEQAAKAGASASAILESVEVGIAMGAGKRTVSARFALDVLGSAYDEEANTAGRPERRSLVASDGGASDGGKNGAAE